MITKIALPCARTDLIRQSLENEKAKLTDENLDIIINGIYSMSISESPSEFMDYYIEECQKAIKTFEALL